jgi:CheY-like chemotaxis protein
MDGETQHRLYEPFFTTKEVGKGTGLGLAVVYGAVQSHRGFIHLESALGKGTTFSLYFPVADSAVVASDVTSTSAGPRGNGELILVVEDEKMLRELLQGLLQNHGYRVLLARDGMEGLSTFEREASKIDLVLSDMGMPKLGGLEMYLRMKESGHSPKLLLCSGFLEPAVKLQLLEAGVTDFLLKPARPAQILRRVHEILQSKGARGSEACLP